MGCCDVKVFVEEIKHIFQLVHLSASQVQCNTHQTISKLGLFQGSRIVAFLTILGFIKLRFMQAHNDVLKQILIGQLLGKHCCNYLMGRPTRTRGHTCHVFLHGACLSTVINVTIVSEFSLKLSSLGDGSHRGQSNR